MRDGAAIPAVAASAWKLIDGCHVPENLAMRAMQTVYRNEAVTQAAASNAIPRSCLASRGAGVATQHTWENV